MLNSFGFNVGSEYGGLHYAVVIDKDNNLSSPVVTVVPLSSTDNKIVTKHNVDLGNELLQNVKAKAALCLLRPARPARCA